MRGRKIEIKQLRYENLNGSGDGVEHSGSLDLWTLSIIRNSK
jgi:hypothetical protein